MAETIKMMTDASGQAVPAKYVKPYDRLRDRKAARIRARWEKARAMLMQV